MKLLATLLLLSGVVRAEIWPEAMGPYHRKAVLHITLQDRPIWDEYGLKESEGAVYEHGKETFNAVGYRLQDTTGAMAAFAWQRPAAAKPSKLAALAAETADGVILAHGNYLLVLTGHKPEPAELAALLDSLRNVDATVLPALSSYLPEQGLVANSALSSVMAHGTESHFPRESNTLALRPGPCHQ